MSGAAVFGWLLFLQVAGAASPAPVAVRFYEPIPVKTLSIEAAILLGGDLVSTELFLRRGFHEQTDIFDNRAVRIAGTTVIGAGVVWFQHEASKRWPRAIELSRWLIRITRGFTIARNLWLAATPCPKPQAGFISRRGVGFQIRINVRPLHGKGGR